MFERKGFNFDEILTPEEKRSAEIRAHLGARKDRGELQTPTDIRQAIPEIINEVSSPQPRATLLGRLATGFAAGFSSTINGLKRSG